MLFKTLFAALLLAAASMAAPVNTPQALIVFNPTITAPTKHMSWPKGSTQEIKWDTENIPAERTATTGVILLGYMENDSENLDIDHPLATGFPLNDGKVTVKMPTDIDSTKDYFVVLFGDSGNKSPVFRIA